MADRLRHAGIPAVLIEDLRGDHIGTSIDLVVSEQDWHKALDVLAGWSQYNIAGQPRMLRHGPVLPGNRARAAPAYRTSRRSAFRRCRPIGCWPAPTGIPSGILIPAAPTTCGSGSPARLFRTWPWIWPCC